MGRLIRLREHVNPLAVQFRQPTPPPDWQSIYQDWNLPLSLDLGSGEGEYLLAMAQQYPDRNFLGLEIRQPLVEHCNKTRSGLGLTNVYFLFCNINNTLPGLLPPGKVSEVTIQFPDPWFKRRQQKRRLVNQELVDTLARLVVPGGRILVQSDVLDTAKSILKQFDAHPQFHNQAGAGLFTDDYPAHIPTERELWAIRKERPIYRMVFTLTEKKADNAAPEFNHQTN